MSARIKTLHLTNAWEEKSGGIATFYRALIQAANEQQREIRLIVPAAQDRIEEIGNHARIYHLQSPAAPLNASYRVVYPHRFLLGGSRIQRILAQEQPDLIEICDKYNFNYLGALLRLGLLRDVRSRPLVLGLSCERMDDNFATYLTQSRIGRWFCSWYMHWLYFPFFDHHVANSEHTSGELLRASRGHAVKRGVWIRPMGVDVSGLSPEHRTSGKRKALLSRAAGREDSVLVLYVGRLAPEKNLGLLLDTMTELSSSGRDFRLLIAGDGMERQQLARVAERSLPGKVLFLGHISDSAQLADLYANSDIFLHPNPREPFGIAPLEAMASGLPLVAPDRGGVTSFANGDNAWLAPPEGESFAAAILALLRDKELRASRVRAGLQTAQQYRWERVTASFFELYDSLSAATHGESTLENCAPAFYSSAPSENSRFVASACAKVAGTAFSGLSIFWSGLLGDRAYDKDPAMLLLQAAVAGTSGKQVENASTST